MHKITELRALAEKLFADIRAISFDGVGVTRGSYSEKESEVADYLSAFAQTHDLHCYADKAANLHFTAHKEDADKAAIWCGSHIDSVAEGGNFDGLAGVIAGLLCLIADQKSGAKAAYPIHIVAFRGEENLAWFGQACTGSSALFGKVSANVLTLCDKNKGDTLAARLSHLGADIAAISRQECLVDQTKIRAFVELHIEQGDELVTQNLPIAIVSGIRGNTCHQKITCLGQAGHSGVAPRHLRKDAVFALCDLVMKMDAHWQAFLEAGKDLVFTCGIFSTNPNDHSLTRIPGQASMSVDMRSTDLATFEAFYAHLQEEAKAIEATRRVRFIFDPRATLLPAQMDAHLRQQLAESCRANNIAYAQIPSGAVHDASLFAQAKIPTAMLFVRNQNGSHNPHEAMQIEDFMAGVGVLYHALLHIS